MRLKKEYEGLGVLYLGKKFDFDTIKLGDESNPEAIVILKTTVMQRIDDNTKIRRNKEVILLITQKQNFIRI